MRIGCRTKITIKTQNIVFSVKEIVNIFYENLNQYDILPGFTKSSWQLKTITLIKSRLEK